MERAGQRRRRYYRLTASGRKVLAQQRSIWDTFFSSIASPGFAMPDLKSRVKDALAMRGHLLDDDVIASVVPARGAASVDPLQALRAPM